MKPIKFKEQNIILTKPEHLTHDECGPLPTYTDGEICISLWKMTFMERMTALFTGRVWLWVWSGKSQPPVCVTTKSPFDEECR